MSHSKRPKLASVAHGRSDDAHAFIPEPGDKLHSSRGVDLLAETLGQEFLASATSAEEVGEELRDERFTEEIGGPFLIESLDGDGTADLVLEPPPSLITQPKRVRRMLRK